MTASMERELKLARITCLVQGGHGVGFLVCWLVEAWFGRAPAGAALGHDPTLRYSTVVGTPSPSSLFSLRPHFIGRRCNISSSIHLSERMHGCHCTPSFTNPSHRFATVISWHRPSAIPFYARHEHRCAIQSTSPRSMMYPIRMCPLSFGHGSGCRCF